MDPLPALPESLTNYVTLSPQGLLSRELGQRRAAGRGQSWMLGGRSKPLLTTVNLASAVQPTSRCFWGNNTGTPIRVQRQGSRRESGLSSTRAQLWSPLPPLMSINTASAKSTKKYNQKNHTTESNNNPERSSGRSLVNYGPDGGRTENQRGDSIVRERRKEKDYLISQGISGKLWLLQANQASFRSQQQIQSDQWLKYSTLGYPDRSQQALPHLNSILGMFRRCVRDCLRPLRPSFTVIMVKW